ncbi:RpoE-regulated lipoprotein [Atlantibacter sp.]|uniref:RpoE-regulated lipoprotein n=1 Tax=Atlantibacter sp. TaxID=1903473 RepID=UPI0028A7AE00|nr:RpoE-regulated lipoprotein [Atlantibacter sp.]
MKLRVLVCVAPLLLSGCSTLSGMNWGAMNPVNWFSSSTEVTENGVGDITAGTAMDEKAITDALDGDYRLRSGMKTANGNIVRYYEALKDDKLAMIINGDNGTVSRIEVLDPDIETASGVKIGTEFSALYSKAYGDCQKGSGDDANAVECQASDSEHIVYLFTGEWRGPEGLMPSDDALKSWKLSKIVWHR